MASTSAVAMIMAKIERNARQLGLTIVSSSGTNVVIDNGSNDFTVSYVQPTITAPMGGVDGSASPFLGIGVVSPGQLKMKSAIATAGTIADVMDSLIAARVVHMLGWMANDIVLENSTASFTATLRGHSDVLGAGQ